MKHIYFFAIGLLLSVCGLSQSIEAVDWPGTVYVDMDSEQTEFAVDVTNVGVTTVTIRVSSIVQSIVSGSEYRFCWGPQCYDFTDTDFTSPDNPDLIVGVQSGSTNSTFYSDFKHNDQEGTSVIDYCWWDSDDPSDESCYTLNWVAGPVSVQEIDLDASISQVSPNPVTGLSSLSYNIEGAYNRASIEIFNLVGELVVDRQLSNPLGIVMINAEDFEDGIYLIRISADGHTFETKKMVIAG